jgi:hypothetical protein
MDVINYVILQNKQQLPPKRRIYTATNAFTLKMSEADFTETLGGAKFYHNTLHINGCERPRSHKPKNIYNLNK